MRVRLAAAGTPALLLIPGALTVFFSFSGGGFFPGSVGVGVLVLLVVVIAHATLSREPFGGISAPLVVGVVCLALLSLWTLLSQTWSDAPSRALIEFDRVLLYLAAFVAMGAVGRTPDRVRWFVRGIALGSFAVCAIALVTRVAPDVWATQPNLANNRLSFPLTYWNALGLLAALGFILCLYLTTSEREGRTTRVLASGALPVLGTALFFTFSRGAIAAGIVGLVAYCLLGRPRALLTGALAAGPATAIAVATAYHADLLATTTPTTPAAVHQGHHVALAVALAVVGACLVRTVLLPVDARLTRFRGPAVLRRRGAAGLATAGLAVATIAVAAALGAPHAIHRQYDRFVHGNVVQPKRDFRRRLTDPGNNGRLVVWRVALTGYRDHPVRGQGAGTFALEWDLLRGPRNQYVVTDAHSLYVEALDELGLVGLCLLALVILLALGRFAWLARGPDRALYAALAAAGLAWALHAGVDWDWEMPAVTLWFFAAAGLALAAPAREGQTRWELPRLGRVVVGIACLLLAVTPARIARSESRLQDARRAFAAGDCTRAIDRALAATSDVDARPEPYEILGFCDVRSGYGPLGVRAMEHAVQRDPRNWELRYGLALVRGAARLDPRPAAAEAVRLNPRAPLAQLAVRNFATSSPGEWERQARRAPLPG